MVHVRFVHVNDVYILDYFPYLAGAIDAAKQPSFSSLKTIPEKWPVESLLVPGLPKPTKLEGFPSAGTLQSSQPDIVIAVLPGDFLSPSLLSGIDKGLGMTMTLNETFSHADKAYVCFGNHEGEVGLSGLEQRIKESKYAWINTNIPGYNNPKLPSEEIIQVIGKDGKTVKIALIGLCVNSSAMTIPSSAFAPSMESFVDYMSSAKEAHERLKDQVDCIIPLTHLESFEDLELLKLEKFPLILGAHDHDVQVPKHTGADGYERSCLKAGVEGEFVFVVDLVWNDATPKDKPEVAYQLMPTTLFPKDQAVQDIVDKSMVKVKAMEKIVLFKEAEEDFLPLSSEGTKKQVTTLTALLLSSIRSHMSAECSIINGGGVRLQKLFEKPTLTYSDLRSLFPYDTDICVVPLPGKVLQDAINFSREPVLVQGQSESNSFIQHDRHVVTSFVTKSQGTELQDDELASNRHDLMERIDAIGGRMFDPEATYRVALPYVLLKGLDNIVPLIEWANSNEKTVCMLLIPSREANLSGDWSKRGWYSYQGGGDELLYALGLETFAYF
jgi:2',3'-cyclic-nucleotide 2'-phosphodiesterase (5'-nucleotidase family)